MECVDTWSRIQKTFWFPRNLTVHCLGAESDAGGSCLFQPRVCCSSTQRRLNHQPNAEHVKGWGCVLFRRPWKRTCFAGWRNESFQPCTPAAARGSKPRAFPQHALYISLLELCILTGSSYPSGKRGLKPAAGGRPGRACCLNWEQACAAKPRYNMTCYYADFDISGGKYVSQHRTAPCGRCLL